MRPLRLATALVAVLALLMPSASAASASGELEAGALRLADDGTLASAGIAVASGSDTVPTLDIEVTDVSIQRFGQTSTRQDGILPPVENNNARIDERDSRSAARLTLIAGAGQQVLALRAVGPSTADVGGAVVRGVGGALVGSANIAGAEGNDNAAADTRCELETCLDIFGAYEIVGDTTAQLSGELILLLYGPTLHVVAAGEERDFASGVTNVESTGPLTQTEDAWVFVRAASATGTLSAPGARLYSVAPTLRTSGVTFEDAEGNVRVGAVEYRASGDDVAALGAIVLTPGAVPPADRHADEATGAPVYATSITTRVAGTVESIDLDGRLAFLDSPAERAGAAAIAAVIVAGAAYGWQHITFGAAALYTRLNKPEILENDVRSTIFDIIRQNPGISAREVHRRSSQSWGTVVYHLRQLERHHLVVSRAIGRTRNYYENHGKYKGMEQQLACLQSDRARVLARAIVGQPGITQEQLAAVSGFPQPTTSYYVRKLKVAGLVEEQRDGRYVKYAPIGDLARFIEMSESSPDLGANTASGVQA